MARAATAAQLAVTALLAACGSSAPYTVPAALINTGVALGVSAAQRSAGGCYATCTGGTTCNPSTGMCEAPSARQVCAQGPGGETRCTPVDVRVSRRAEDAKAPAVDARGGVSPATGAAPPPPAEASPRAP